MENIRSVLHNSHFTLHYGGIQILCLCTNKFLAIVFPIVEHFCRKQIELTTRRWLVCIKCWYETFQRWHPLFFFRTTCCACQPLTILSIPINWLESLRKLNTAGTIFRFAIEMVQSPKCFSLTDPIENSSAWTVFPFEWENHRKTIVSDALQEQVCDLKHLTVHSYIFGELPLA